MDLRSHITNMNFIAIISGRKLRIPAVVFFFLFSILETTPFELQAKPKPVPCLGCTIVGTNPAIVGNTYTYTLSGTCSATSWSTTCGTIESSTAGSVTIFFNLLTCTSTTIKALNSSGTVASLVVTLNQPPALVPGTISNPSQTINYNVTPAPIDCSLASGGSCGGAYTYQWYSSTNNTSFTAISGATEQNYQPGALTTTTYFKRAVTCEVLNYSTNTAQVTVYPQLVGGTLSPATQTINSGAVPGHITLSNVSGGNTSYTYQWYSSPDNSSWSVISGQTSTVYAPPALTVATYYRVLVTSNGVASPSSSALVTLYPPIVPGSVSSSQTINYNTVPAPLSLTNVGGGNGAYTYQWSYSTNGGGTWSQLSGVTGATYAPGALTTTTEYEVTVTSNGVTATSGIATITVYPQLVSGTISPAAQTINYNRVPVILTDSGTTGGSGTYSYQWQSAAASGGPFSPISGATGTSYSPPALTSTGWYEVVTTSNGVHVTSSAAIVNVNPQVIPGTINPSGISITAGSNPGPFTSDPAMGGACNGAFLYQWQSAPDNSTWTNISGATNLIYNPGNLSNSVYYRIMVICGTDTEYSTSAQIQITTAAANLNYIRTRAFSKPGVMDTVTADGLTSPYDVQQTTTYYDGLGRPLQTVAMQASPLQNDMVMTHLYDPYGRETIVNLPYTSPSNDGNYKTNPTDEQSNFNAAQFPGEQYYYAETGFEPSPLNRVLYQYAPGNSWVGSGRSAGTQYLINTVADSVQQWEMMSTTGLQVAVTPYSTDSLQVTYTCSNLPSNHGTVLYLYQVQGSSGWTTGYVNGGPSAQIEIPAGNYSYAIQVQVGSNWFYVYPGASGTGFTIAEVYSTGSLDKLVTTDENGNQTIEFKDKRGFTLLKKVQSGPVTAASPYTNWLCTYYIYDDDNNLSFVIPPLATQQLWVSGWSVPPTGIASASFAKELCFQYIYDGKNRLVSKAIPGGGVTYTVYDTRDRVVMTQDSNLITQGKWLVNEYDSLNRRWRTGLLTDPNNQTYHQSLALYSINYPNTTGSNYEVLTQTYYDDYTWVAGSGVTLPTTMATNYSSNSNDFITSYNSSPTYAVSMTGFLVTRGMVTGSRTEVLGSNGGQYLGAVNFYDDRARAIQVQSTNYTSGVDTLTNQYDFTGKPLRKMLSHAKLGNTPQYHTVITKIDYDQAFRLRHIWKNIDGAAADQLIDSMQYNELGQLSTKYLGNNVDSMIYTYNIRGWLSGINANYVAGTTTHYFGMELGYDRTTSVAPGNTYLTPEFNGNIEGTVWKTAGSGLNRKYDFSYDPADRLTAAAFLQNTSGSAWDKNQVDFSVSNLSYDPNGNIQTMTQRGFLVGGSQVIDSLAYSYFAGTNKLMQVVDAENDSTSQLGDFHYSISKVAGTPDYAYDGNGNLIKDTNKVITAISYNYLNLPQLIHFQNKGNITYVYDADGEKLAKITADSVAKHSVRTLYLDNMVYQQTDTLGNTWNGIDTLQLILHEEGRTRWAYQKFKSGTTGYSFQYDFFEKDHLGNTRMILTQERDTTNYLASMEAAYRSTESQLFGNITNTCVAWNSVPNYQNIPTNTLTSVTNPNDSVSLVDYTGSGGQTTGPSLLLKVMSGDTVTLGVQCYYNSNTVTNTNSSFSAVLNSLAADLVGTPTGAAEGGVPGYTASGGPVYLALTSFLTTYDPGAPAGYPKAYLNWILLDDQFNYVSSSSGSVAAASNTYPAGQLNKVAPGGPIIMPRNGYLYIWVSNETQGWDVFFDNLCVQYKQGPLLEENHYYPFGLSMSGLSDKALKSNYAQNKYRYNGKELQNQEFSDGSGLEEYDYALRFQDPQLGRWWTIDPKADQMRRFSPYNYAYDNPIRFVDPDGMGPEDIVINGDKTFRQQAFNDLQKLSSTPLALLGNGTVVQASNVGNEKVELSGTPQTDSKTGTAIDKPVGTALVNDLIKSDKVVTITQSDNGQDHTSPEDAENAKNGTGTNSVVNYNPQNTENGSDKSVAVKNEDGTTGAPAQVFLGHELGHAQDIKNGTDSKEPSKATDPDTGKPDLTNGEVKARQTENKIRSENGVVKRATPQQQQ